MSNLVGKIIKSYDFPHTVTSYMIGRVVSHADSVVECDTIKQVFAGKEEDIVVGFNDVFRTQEPGAHYSESVYIAGRFHVIG